MPQEPNSFDVMKRMSAENRDILMCPDLVEAKTTRRGGHVTFGVPAELIYKLMSGRPKYKVFMMALNEDDYKAVQAALVSEQEKA